MEFDTTFFTANKKTCNITILEKGLLYFNPINFH